MFNASAAIVAKKLLVDDQITAYVRQICLLGETFCSFEKRLLSSNLSFCYELLIGPQQTSLECIVIFL